MKRQVEDQGNNAARILNMAVSSQLQHQQNFRLHQQRYLAPNPNRKPSEDDLFEMASMLLDPPRQEAKANWMMDRSTTMMNSNPSMSMSGHQGNHYHHHGQMTTSIRRNTSPTKVNSGDLFDDDELDSVLGDVSQSSNVQQQQYQTITPETSERANRETEIFLPEMTLEELLQSSNEATTTTNTTNEDQNQDQQWCLIDFGDDDDGEDTGLSSKKRPSLEGFDIDLDFPFHKKSRQ